MADIKLSHGGISSMTQHVIANGDHLRILVNGIETANFVDWDHTFEDGYLALLMLLPAPPERARVGARHVARTTVDHAPHSTTRPARLYGAA